ncbi:MAG TPA: L,D-transpeptidase family protein [Candidatus Binataceae bacterium]|nr:L,D-transpeptidase family protein [Candidatus Binataceae bacterium]
MLQTSIEAARDPALRWPNFADDRAYVAQFYEAGGYELAWSLQGRPTPQATGVIYQLENADLKGLLPEDYDGPRWPARLAQLQQQTPPDEASLVRFDLELTVCAMRLVSDLHEGKVNPASLQFALSAENRSYDLASFLRERVINSPPGYVPLAFQEVEPPFGAYYRVQAELPVYEALARKDDGTALPLPAKSVKAGGQYAALAQLTSRLRLVGDLSGDAQVGLEPPVYQHPLVEAVANFQRRHGLDDDGVLGPATIRALNVPMSERVEQLRLTLERWRWLPHQYNHPPVVVNIPEFRLRTWDESERKVLEMNVVVGKAYHHKTPVFSAMMRYVIFRPYWEVPIDIQEAELVPKLRRDPDYLAKNQFEVVTGSGGVVTDDQVSGDVLSRLSAGALFVRQKPGDKNALGPVKFIFPNSYSVYLHGTPAHSLFAKSRRDFSHGCIRVEDPLALATWVLANKPGWNKDRIAAMMNGSEVSMQVNLDRPIPVLILYGTAAVKQDGQVYFYNDIYGYDDELENAMANAYSSRQ